MEPKRTLPGHSDARRRMSAACGRKHKPPVGMLVQQFCTTSTHGGFIMAEFASKGVAGAGLGLGIAGTALGLLNNNGGGIWRAVARGPAGSSTGFFSGIRRRAAGASRGTAS